MSHEIRPPMNAIIGMTHLALKTELTPKQQNYLHKIDISAKSLLGIINDILDFSKIEAGKLEMETIDFNLTATFAHVADIIMVKAREKDNLEILYRVDPQIPPYLTGDPTRLSQVLLNLGNNAVKFTEQGEITLFADFMDDSSDQVRLKFTVRDSGIGMTPEQREKLFKAFSQAIRRDPKFKDLPIIAMTANAMTQDVKKASEAGMNDHLAKPVNVKKLFAILLKWIAPTQIPRPEAERSIHGDLVASENIHLPDLPGIDTQKGLQNVNGKKRLYLNTIEKFLNNQSEAAAQIRAALDANDVALAHRIAHTVKGIAGMIGAGSLSKVAGELEASLKKTRPMAAVDLLKLLKTRLKVFLPISARFWRPSPQKALLQLPFKKAIPRTSTNF